jgi:hypothetical protein
VNSQLIVWLANIPFVSLCLWIPPKYHHGNERLTVLTEDGIVGIVNGSDSDIDVPELSPL